MKKPFDRPTLSNLGGNAMGGFSSSPLSRNAGIVGTPKNDYMDRVAAAYGENAPQHLTSDNYTRVYQQQREAEIDAQKKKREGEGSERFARDKAQRKISEQKQADAYISRARDLRTQISLWHQKLGQNPETDRCTQAAIDQLTFELNGIPSIYWK